MFFRLLLESFRRQRRRKLLAGIAILLGTTAVTAMLALATTIGDRIHAELAVYGANIIVTPEAANLAVNIGGTDIHPATGNAYLHESDLAKLQTIFWHNNITAISPELVVSLEYRALVTGHPFVPVKIVGVWFDHNLSGLRTGAPPLHPWWKLTGNWPILAAPHEDYVPVVLGARLAERLSLRVGSAFALESPDARARSITPNETIQVIGIVATGDATDDLVIVPLTVAQSLNNTPDAVDRVEIAARTRPEDAFARVNPDTLSPKQRDLWYCRPYANSIAYQIREAIPNADAQQVRRVEQSEGNVLKRISGLMWLISAAALLAAGFAVSAAMATAVLERRAEIGLMRSLGASQGRIALLFYVEAAILALLSGTLGYLSGSTLAAALGRHIFTGAAPVPTLNPVLLPIITGLALLVAVAGSTPAIRSALRINPSTILRADA